MEFDNVMKQCVLDQDVNDGRMLNKDFVKDFKAEPVEHTQQFIVLGQFEVLQVSLGKRTTAH